MGGVDRGDQPLTYYGYPHRTAKWWRRAFFYLFDAAIVNSYIMYCQRHEGRRLTHEQFRVELAKDLLRAANSQIPSIDSPHGPRRQIAGQAGNIFLNRFGGR